LVVGTRGVVGGVARRAGAGDIHRFEILLGEITRFRFRFYNSGLGADPAAAV